MKRSDMLRTKLTGPIDTIQMCRDIVEGNFNAMTEESPSLCSCGIDSIELQARIYTDMEILARNQADYPEPSSAAR